MIVNRHFIYVSIPYAYPFLFIQILFSQRFIFLIVCYITIFNRNLMTVLTILIHKQNGIGGKHCYMKPEHLCLTNNKFIHVSHLPYSFIRQQVASMSWLCDTVKGCNEHWGSCAFLNYGFLRVYAQKSDCWVIWQFCFQFSYGIQKMVQVNLSSGQGQRLRSREQICRHEGWDEGGPG